MINLRFIPAVELRQVTEVGLLAVAGCLLAGLYQEQPIWYKVALLLTIMILWMPRIFNPVAIIWYTASHLLGRIMTNLLLIILFVCLIVPITWCRKVMGSDPFRVKQFKKNSDSVFLDREHVFQASDLNHPF